MADVQLVQHGNGDYSLGVEIDGVYVPFASVSSARVAHLKERAASLQARSKSQDDEDRKLVEAAYKELPVSASSREAAPSSPEPESQQDYGDGGIA